MYKKMYTHPDANASYKSPLSYTVPKIHKGKSWYVDFQSFDPALGRMHRKRYMLNHIKQRRDRETRATELVAYLYTRLREGWSPWVESQHERGYTLLADALGKFAESIERMQKYKTRKDYSSRLSVLQEFLSTRVTPPQYVYQFDTALVSSFLDWVYIDRESTARTRNNYRAWCSALAAFFIERQYITSNPVEQIKMLKEDPKHRQPLSASMLKRLTAHLRKTDKPFLLACMMEYYTMIRPHELCQVRLEHINLKEQSVFIPASVSKNNRDGKTALNRKVIKLMLDLDVFSHPEHCFLFGRNFQVCERRGESQMFRRRWQRLREEFNWGEEYQFYSLKDSGVRDLANDKGIVVARDQARHTDVATTNKYLQGRDAPVHDEAKEFEGEM